MASILPAERGRDENTYTVFVARVRTPGGGTLTRTFAKVKDAERWAAEQEGKKATGRLPDNIREARRPFGEYADEWMTERDLRERTRDSYTDVLTRFVLPTFKDVQLGKITPSAVRRWYSKLLAADDKAGRSHNQTAKSYQVLRAIMNTAVADEIIAASPCRIRGAGVQRSAERPLIDPGEVFVLADKIEPHLRALVLTAAFVGLRRGELLALRRRHINILHKTITVEAQAIRTGAKDRLETAPKTDAGKRTRPMPPFLAEELAAHMEKYTPAGKDSHVFVGAKGAPLSIVALQRAWTAAREAAGIEGVTLHDLRHAGATYLAWTGATTRELMQALGHSSSAAAMKYQHAAEGRAAELANRLDAIAIAARDTPREEPTPIRRDKSATKAPRKAIG